MEEARMKTEQKDVIQNNQQSYHKQFVYYSNKHNPALYHYRIEFQNKSNLKILPSSYVDHYVQEPVLYLLYWQKSQHQLQLIIQPYRQSFSIEVIYNSPPSHIIITDKHLFSFSNQELFITSLSNQADQLIIPLIFGPVIEASPCFTQLNEPGVAVIYFTKKDGYIKRQYSKSSKYNRWQKYINFLRIRLEQHQQYEDFKIIIPNLLALVYLKTRWFIYDLNQMKIIDNLQGIQLQRRQQFKLTWDIIQPNEDGNDGVRICISNGQKIVIYDLHIVRLKVNMERIQLNKPIQRDQYVSLNMIIGGKVINWQQSTLIKHQIEVKTKHSIFTLKLYNNHLSYIETLKGLTFIPNLVVINLTKSHRSSIILKQSTIWLNYFKDISNNELTQDRLLVPNKYHQSIVQQIITSNSFSLQNKHFLQNRQQILLLAVNKWRQFDELNDLIIYQGHLMIVRKNTVNRLSKISQWQYKFQQFNEEQKGQMQQINRKREGDDSVNPCQRKGKIDDKLIENEYRSCLLSLKKYVQFEYDVIENDSCSIEFTSAIIKDKIIHFSELIKYGWNVYHKQQPTYLKNKIIIKIMNYFYNNLCHSYSYLNIFNTSSLIDLLFQTYSSLFCSDIQLNSSIFFKIILQNILPSRYTQSSSIQQDTFATNQYLQFIITLLIDSQSSQSKLQLLQLELKSYFKCIFDTSLTEYLQIIYNNSSLIQAYLLTHPSQEEVQKMYVALLKRYNYEDVAKVVCRVANFIGDSVDCLFQTELKERSNKYLTKIFIDESWKNSKLNNNDSPNNYASQNKQKSLQLAKSILLTPKLHPIRPTFSQNIKNLHHQFLNIQKLAIQQYIKVYPKINNFLTEILPFQIANYNFQNILEINQYCMMYCLRVFNRQFNRVLEGNASNFGIMLLQLQQFYYNYKKYYNRLYSNTSTHQKKTSLTKPQAIISLELQKDQSISTNKLLKEVFTISDIPCSQLLLKILKQILSSTYLSQLINKYKKWNIGLIKYMQQAQKYKQGSYMTQQSKTSNNIFIMKFIEQYLKFILKQQKITSNHAMFINYYYHKKGKMGFKKIINKKIIIDKLLDYYHNNHQISCEDILEIIQEIKRQSNQGVNKMENLIKNRNL